MINEKESKIAETLINAISFGNTVIYNIGSPVNDLTHILILFDTHPHLSSSTRAFLSSLIPHERRDVIYGRPRIKQPTQKQRGFFRLPVVTFPTTCSSEPGSWAKLLMNATITSSTRCKRNYLSRTLFEKARLIYEYSQTWL